MIKRLFGIFTFSFLLFFLSWLGVYKLGVNKLAVQSEDTIPAILLPVAIIKNHTMYLDDYYNMMVQRYPHPDDKSQQKGLTPYYLRKAGSHYVSAFPIITPLLSLPVYFLPVSAEIPITWDNLILLSKLSAAFIVSISGVFMYLLLIRHFSLSDQKSLYLTAVYLFGSINFSLISQSMWQHGALQFFIILGLLFLFESFGAARRLRTYMLLSGVSFGLAVLSRPTAALVLLFVLAYLIWQTRTRVKLLTVLGTLFMLGMLIAGSFFYWYNKTFYLSVANQGYSNQILTNWLSPFPQGFLGVWFSPSKGILVYSPVFLFSFVGLYLAVRNRVPKLPFYITSASIVLLHTLVISVWKHWYGGWSYGYRMSADIIPFLVILLVPYFRSELYDKTKTLFKAAFLFSVMVEVFGIVFFDGIWHAAYDKGFIDTTWLWSIKDSEFIFNIRRILVKVGLLTKACPLCLPGTTSP